MASSPEFTHFACGQYIGTGSITCKKMFGEYGVYLNEKIIALICDNQFYLKKTDAGRAILGTDAQEAPPYPGANPYFLIDRLDDTEWFTGLLDSAYAELPEPKPKKSKKSSAKRISGASSLEGLPNIGEKLASQLRAVGIRTPEDLKAAGSREAWLRIRAMDPSACIMRLNALEGAIRGVRWHDLDEKTKSILRAFYHSHK